MCKRNVRKRNIFSYKRIFYYKTNSWYNLKPEVFLMIKIYIKENCVKCRLTERLFNVENVDFEVAKPDNSDIRRFRE